MKLVFISTKNLNTREPKKIELVGCVKRFKDVKSILSKFMTDHALENQWNLLFNSGSGVSGGYRYQYIILDISEDVKPQPKYDIYALFKEVKQ